MLMTSILRYILSPTREIALYRAFFIMIVVSMTYDSVCCLLGVAGITGRYLYGCIAICFTYVMARGIVERRLWLRPEALLLIAWLLWTVTTAVLFHVQPGERDYAFTSDVFRGPFFALMVFVAVNGYSSIRKDMWVVLGFAFSGAVLAILVVLSGQLGSLSHSLEGRLGESVSGNSNEFAYLLLLAVVAAWFFHYPTALPQVRQAVVLLVLALSVLVVLSASRKAFLGELVFFLSMSKMSSVKRLLYSRRHLLLIAGTFAVPLAAYAISQTYLGERLLEVWRSSFHDDTSFAERFDGRGRFYQEGFHLVRERPGFGIGLRNYRRYDTYGYAAHSDYIAVAAETGIPGALLYFSAFLVVIARLNAVIGRCQEGIVEYRCRVFRGALFMILFLALGRWNYDHIPTYALLGTAGAYAALVAELRGRVSFQTDEVGYYEVFS